MSEPRSKCWTVDELAEVLRVNHDTVRRMLAREDIQPAFKTGRDWRIPPTAKIRAGREFLALRELVTP